MSRLAAACLLVCAALCGTAQAQDKIVSKDGKERKAKVLSEDFDGLKLSMEGGSLTVPWKDVDTILYGGATKYHEAIDAFAAEGPGAAVPLLEEVAADEKLRPVLLHGTLYHLGLAQKQLGNVDASIAAFEKLLQQFPRSRYLVPAGTSLLSLYVAKGDPAGAARTLDAALAAAGSSGSTGGVQVGFDFLRGRVLEEQGKYPDAERLFQSVAGATGDDAHVALAAKLALGRCAQRANRNGDAEQRYRELVAQAAPNEVLAGAWNGLGDLALAEGSAQRDQDGLRSALFAYLRGVVLYVPGRGQATDEHERALAGASRAFRAISELEADAARKKLFQDRAQQRRAQLAAEFPSSRFLEGL
jgi:tetratricopeptide (TPR) repeat protein